MRKKFIALLLVAALAALIAAPAFAETTQDAKSWFESRFAAKQAWVDQAVKDGRITAEQGETWKNHFNEMYKFQEQNGFTCPMGGPGQGRGQGFGMGNGQGFGRGGGMGGGMGWGVQAPAQQ
ncbi:MAG: hypothetical protein JL50_01400 [Peptococcaceae bacterium BICA1-7]|nr:MAG: hypothetical protein JL50_01400 [Peptococcaceae bacterium BICA1-7]HBV97956.1 DUF2680 domain-containing protein [Desulfotomaculum sp.]